jgi:hypothetical protein
MDMPWSGMSDRLHSPQVTVVAAAATSRQSEEPIVGEVSTPARSTSVASILDDLADPQGVVEVDTKQE